MSEMELYGSGFDELSKLLEEYQVSESDVLDVLEDTAEAFVQDIRKLPRPRSEASVAGYTHLLDTVIQERNGKEIEVGWGKYYGRMVEKGTCRMRGTPHMQPTFLQNQGRYFKDINKKLFK